jgi:hypothetical protein
VDTESLSGFVASYQSVNVLKLGELWAIPIMLRLALIENLRQITSRISHRQNQSQSCPSLGRPVDQNRH